MSRSVLLVLNGLPDPGLLARVIPGQPLLQPLGEEPARPQITEIVAVDGGLAALEAVGLRPDRILGDLDSIASERLKHWRQAEVPIDHRPDPASSDLEKALEYAATSGFTHVDIAGWQGTRWDHVLGLLSLLDHEPRQHPRLLSGRQTLRVLTAGTHDFSARPGDGVGLVRFGTWPCRITLAGLEYPADDLVLEAGCRAASNRVREPRFRVTVSGCPVFLTHIPQEERDDTPA